MDRLRAILVLRAVLGVFFAGLGAVLLASGTTVFGIFAIAVGVVNLALVVVLARRSRRG